jgi:hypothetical protein
LNQWIIHIIFFILELKGKKLTRRIWIIFSKNVQWTSSDGFVEEEKQRQLINYGIDLYRIWKDETSASSEFIAKFRLMNHQIVKMNDLEIIDRSCSVCLEKYQANQWPCTTQHKFHYACMLNILRIQNTCPLCSWWSSFTIYKKYCSIDFQSNFDMII